MELVIKSEPRSGDGAYRAIHARMKATQTWRNERRIGDKQWRRADNLVLGKHWAENPSLSDLTSDMPRDRITVNITASTIQDYLPFLVRQKPQWVLKPRPKAMSPEEIEIEHMRAKVSSYLLNYHYGEFGMHTAYRAAVDDGLTYGHGVTKSGWALELAEAVKPRAHGHIEMDSMLRVNNPVLSRVDPFKFYFDPTAPDATLRTARWASELIYMPLADVVQNKMFSDARRRQIGNGRETPTAVTSYLTDMQPDLEWLQLAKDELDSQRLVVLYEHWDKKFEKYYVFADGIEKPLVEEDTSKFPYLDGFFPYCKWDFIRRNGEPYGFGIPYLIEDQQLELNRVRTSEFEHRRKYAKSKFGITEGAMDGTEQQKLTSDRDETFTVKGPVDQAIRAFNAPPISSDNYRVDAIIQEDIRRMLGLDQLMSGGSLPSRTSAREVDARQSLIGTKLQGRVESVDQFAMEVGQQVWKHLQKHLTDQQVAAIAGPMASAVWEPKSNDDIQGDFAFELISSSKEEHDPVQERQQRTNLMQVMFNNAEMLAQQGHMVNTPAVLKWVLDAYDRPETGAFIQEIPPAPVQEGGGQEVALGSQDKGQQINQQSAGAGSAVAGQALGGGLGV